jgi:hypothetical protein
MLRLLKIFDLEKDVYPKIPHNRLEKASKSSNDLMSFEQIKLAVIGHEKSGHIVVTYNGVDQAPVSNH